MTTYRQWALITYRQWTSIQTVDIPWCRLFLRFLSSCCASVFPGRLKNQPGASFDLKYKESTVQFLKLLGWADKHEHIRRGHRGRVLPTCAASPSAPPRRGRGAAHRGNGSFSPGGKAAVCMWLCEDGAARSRPTHHVAHVPACRQRPSLSPQRRPDRK